MGRGRHVDKPVGTRDRVTGDADGLSPAQAEAVAAVAGGGGLELIVGPAGTGKTTTLTSSVAQRRPVFGVAPTAAAAEVLATETSMAADTLVKLLIENRDPTRPPGSAYDLPARTTVIVDEAGTATTPKLADLDRPADNMAGGSSWSETPPVLSSGPRRHVRPPRRQLRSSRAGSGTPFPSPLGTPSQPPSPRGRPSHLPGRIGAAWGRKMMPKHQHQPEVLGTEFGSKKR